MPDGLRGPACQAIAEAAQVLNMPANQYQTPASSRSATPSFSAAIRVPLTRFVIFWNATSRAYSGDP